MTIETEIAALTTATTDLLSAVNVSKITLDTKVADATAQAGTATIQAAAAANSALTVTEVATVVDNMASIIDVSTNMASVTGATTQAATATTQASAAATSATNAEAARAAAVVAQNNAVAVVTGGTGSLTAAPAKLPLANSAGQLDISWLVALSGLKVNDIGVPNTPGAGVGICPAVPVGYTPLAGFTDKLDANHGGYQYSDGSVMHWVPAFWIRRGHPDNPTYGIYGESRMPEPSA